MIAVSIEATALCLMSYASIIIPPSGILFCKFHLSCIFYHQLTDNAMFCNYESPFVVHYKLQNCFLDIMPESGSGEWNPCCFQGKTPVFSAVEYKNTPVSPS